MSTSDLKFLVDVGELEENFCVFSKDRLRIRRKRK